MSNLCDVETAFCATVALGDGRNCPYRDGCQCYAAARCPLTRKGALPNALKSCILRNESLCYPESGGCCNALSSVEMMATDYLRKGEVQGPPVPSGLVAVFDPQRNIEVRSLPLKAYSGGTWLVGNEWVIHLSDKESRQQKRYTLFHEAFHIACRTVCPTFKKVAPSSSPFNELLADYFANCILMPKEWIKAQWAKVGEVRERKNPLLAGTPGNGVAQQFQRLSQADTLRNMGLLPVQVEADLFLPGLLDHLYSLIGACQGAGTTSDTALLPSGARDELAAGAAVEAPLDLVISHIWHGSPPTGRQGS